MPRILPAPVLFALVAAVAAVACAERGDDADGAPPPPADATRVEEIRPALPEGAEAVSLLGEPLTAPPPTESVREQHEANYARATAELEAAPEDADALIWAGRRAAYLGRYREAIEIYTRGLELHPEDARFLRHRGHRWITVRELDRAVTDLQRAAELVRGTEDEVEPDGLPNERGIPTSTLHFNIWYHLGLAHYLKGELEQALLAWTECMAVSRHPDTVVATAYWLNNTALRLGLEERSRTVLERITPGMDIIESTSYMDVLLLHKGLRTLPEVTGQGDDPEALESVTTAYGVGNWHYVNGRTDDAFRIWEGIVERGTPWAAFGYIAAESEIARRP